MADQERGSEQLTATRQRIDELETAVAECRQVERQLRSEIDRLRVVESVVQESPDGSSVVDRSYVYRAVNRVYLALHCRPADQIIGHTVADLLGEEVFQHTVRPQLDRCFAGEPVRYESWFTYPSAGRRYMEIRYYPLRRDDKVEYVVVVGHDITERKLAEEVRSKLAEEQAARAEAEAARQRIDNILESITDAFFTLDREWRFTYVNREAERSLRKTREALLGKNVWEEFPDAVSLPFYTEYHKAMSEQVPVVFEAVYPPYNMWFEVRAYPSPEGLSVYFHDVTGRKQAEQALRESEAKYRSLYNVVEAGIVIHGPAGQIADANETAREILGLTHEQMLGLTSIDPRWRAIHDDGSPFPGETHPAQVALRTGERIRGVIMGIVRPDGNRRWLLVNAQPIVAQGTGAIMGSVATFMDITRRKIAEEAIARLAAIVESSEDSIISMSLDGIIMSWNPGAERLYGFTADEMVGNSIAKIIPPDCSNELPQNLERTKRGERVKPYETVRMTKQGRRTDVSLGVSPIRNASGKVIAASAISHDITDRKRAEAERERLLAELDSTITSIADGLIIYDAAGNIVRTNPAAHHILGLPWEVSQLPLAERMALLRAETADGKPFPIDQLPSVRALRGERVYGVIIVVHRPRDGRTVWLSSSSAPIRTPDGNLRGAVSVITDVTAQHNLHEWLQDLIRTISHDLRNPLMVIQGQAQLLLRALDGAGLVGAERRSTEAILTGAARMNAMIQDLVESARLESGQLHLEKLPVDLIAAICDFLDRAKVVMDVERIRVEIPEGLPPVCADPHHLERILTNLISNALKYSPPEAMVLIKATRTDADVAVSLTDQGIGIAPEDLSHIFDRFYQPKAGREAGGLGLGLYTSRMLVEAHGGRIWMESQPGQGSTFYFTLPQA